MRESSTLHIYRRLFRQRSWQSSVMKIISTWGTISVIIRRIYPTLLNGPLNRGVHTVMSKKKLKPTEACLEHASGILFNTHTADKCAGDFCTIHNRSDHCMRSFPQHWRSDRGIMERICPCGIGHPDPDSPWASDSYEWIHGCCGHCSPGGYEALNGG